MSATLTLTHIRTLPNDRRSNPIDEDELEEERETLLIKYNNCSKGLGIKIIGGCSVDGEEDYGIFVKRVLPGGLAQLEGQLQNGDQILKVNGDSLEGVTNDRAVAILRKASASNVVSLLVSRDHQAREEFGEVLERQNLVSHNCTPVPTETPSRASSKTSSRSTSPSFTEGKSNGSPRNENLHQTHNQENGLMDSPRVQSEEPPPAHGQITPVTNRTLPVAQVERFGARIQPDMASTPHGGRLKGLPSYSDSQSILAGSHNLSPVLASPAATVTTPLTHNSHTPALGTGGGSQPQGPSQLPQSQDMSQTRKLSLDPHVRLKVERLEDALRYLGLDPTLEQQAALRRNLHVDPSGTVSYGEFVKEAREVFRMQLDEQNIGQGAMLFAAQDLTSLVDPPPFKPELSTIPDTSVNEDLELIRKERDNLSKEVDRLKALLKEKEESCSVAEDEILRIRRQAQGAIHETRSLRSKVHLAEQAQRAARSMEQDYEEVVRLLEKEIADMRTELHRKQETPNAELEKRLAVVSCQLRKTDSAKKTFEVATEKLLQFVEHVHETLRNEESSASRSRIESGEPSRGTRPPGYLGKHKAPGVRGLASEAREVVKAVKSLTDSQGLPYGWEEAYTEDGMRYYINHLTQMTTWSHPVSNIHHLPTIHQQPGSDATGQKAPAPGQRSEMNGPQASASGNGAAHRGIPLSKGSGKGIRATEPSQVSR